MFASLNCTPILIVEVFITVPYYHSPPFLHMLPRGEIQNGSSAFSLGFLTRCNGSRGLLGPQKPHRPNHRDENEKGNGQVTDVPSCRMLDLLSLGVGEDQPTPSGWGFYFSFVPLSKHFCYFTPDGCKSTYKGTSCNHPLKCIMPCANLWR